MLLWGNRVGYRADIKHSGREEQAFLTSLAGLILVLMWIVPYIYDLFKTIQKII